MRDLFSDPPNWDARLRSQRVETHSAGGPGESVTVTSAAAIVQTGFELGLLDRLANPLFLAIERKTEQALTHLIYEAIIPKPIHFQQLGMNAATPMIIRREMLQTIDESWGRSDESWIDIVAVPMDYRLDLNDDGTIEFKRTKLRGLVGARAHILSRETVGKFLSMKDGTTVAALLGFELPLKINMHNLIRYHSACLGFTGSGKSNLTSHLMRKALEALPDLHIIIFDIAGEYFVNLADLFADAKHRVYSTEKKIRDADRLLDAQVVPETLEADPTFEEKLRAIAERIISEKRFLHINVEDPEESDIFSSLLDKLKMEEKSGRAGATQAPTIRAELDRLLTEDGLTEETLLKSLTDGQKKKFSEYLSIEADGMGKSSALYSLLKSAANMITTSLPGSEKIRAALGPKKLAEVMLQTDRAGAISLIYIPEPTHAREFVSQFIKQLLYLKKTTGKAKEKVLIILDEAQEYIPLKPRKEDGTEESSRAVEALLRQGRKYRAHCWLGSQRVAHLNVTALQQVHSYFINILPSTYDRMKIADAFGISYDVLDKTVDLETGQWLFVSYKATQRKNVPVFVQTPNNEDALVKGLGIVMQSESRS